VAESETWGIRTYKRRQGVTVEEVTAVAAEHFGL
jgi:hypothetical protein